MKLEPSAHMFPSDLEKFKTEETFAQAFSVEVGRPGESTISVYAIPDTHVVVPKEPTEAMIEAGMDAPRKDSDTFLCAWREDVDKVWKAMIAAGEQ